MVNSAFHDISKVIDAAQRGKVHFASRSAEQRTTEEGFSHEDVCDCIACISTESYKTTLQFEGSPTPFDVHLCQFRGDIVYIKLKLTCEGMVLVLASFHRSEYSV